MNRLKHLQQQWLWKRRQKQHRLAQGRLTISEAAAQLSIEGNIPLATVTGQTVSAEFAIPTEDDGHLLLVAPPDSKWREHLANILIRWPGAALIADPNGSLYLRTGHLRDTTWGKVYAIPGYRFNLARYYPFWDLDSAVKLHNFLVPPAPPADEWLLDNSVSLMQALGHYSFFHKRNPIQTMLDAAAADLYNVLSALSTVPTAWPHASRFIKGLSLEKALSDSDIVRSFALFARQMRRYQKTYSSFAIEQAEDVLPHDWAKEPNAVYLTYSLNNQQKLAGLTAALIDGLRRYYHTYGRYSPLLLVLDTTLAYRLPSIEQILAEATIYGITVVLTAVSLSSLNKLAADSDGAALAGRFAHQVWYPSHDRQTADHIAWLYGTKLTQAGEDSTELVVNPHEILAWPNQQVLVYTRQERPYRFLAERVTMPTDLQLRLPPEPPQVTPTPRDHLAWLPAESENKESADEEVVAADTVKQAEPIPDVKPDNDTPVSPHPSDNDGPSASSIERHVKKIDLR